MEKKYKENKFTLFLKKNIYAILMVVCLLAIIGLVAYTVVVAETTPAVPQSNGVVDASGQPVDKQQVSDDKTDQSGQTDNDAATSKPVNGTTDSADVFVMDVPIADAEVLKEYTDTALVYNATMKHWATHQGIDYKAEVGTAVRAVFDGEVTEITTTTMRGTQVTLKHSNGFSTTYALLGPSVPVKVGDKVKKGAVLGYVAQTGYFESADEPHLHFELRRDGNLTDPNYYFSGNDNK